MTNSHSMPTEMRATSLLGFFSHHIVTNVCTAMALGLNGWRTNLIKVQNAVTYQSGYGSTSFSELLQNT